VAGPAARFKRRGEVARLTTGAIDSCRMLIRVEQGKGGASLQCAVLIGFARSDSSLAARSDRASPVSRSTPGNRRSCPNAPAHSLRRRLNTPLRRSRPELDRHAWLEGVDAYAGKRRSIEKASPDPSESSTKPYLLRALYHFTLPQTVGAGGSPSCGSASCGGTLECLEESLLSPSRCGTSECPAG
jgi:hypothetical protein